MPEIDADAEIARQAQELEVTDEEYKVKFREQTWISRNPYNWPANWMDLLSTGQLYGVLKLAFSEDQAEDMLALEPPISMVEALGLLSAIQAAIGNELGKSRRSGRSSAPIPRTSRPTSKRTTKSISSTTGEDG